MNWLEPLQYEFMLKALFSSALVGGLCGVLSVFLLLKGWSLIGDALSHAVIPGVAVAYLWRLPFAVGAFVAGLLAVGAMLLLRRLKMLKQDAVIGFVFTVFFAGGLFLNSLYPKAINLQAVIYGNILGIADSDLWQLLFISLMALTLILLKWRDLMLIFFDEIQALTVGLPVRRLQALFFILVSLAVVSALQTVGAILVIALLITPGATAFLLTKRFSAVLISAFLLGVMSGLLGTYFSYFLDVNTGSLIVLIQTGLFLIVFLFHHFKVKSIHHV